MHSEALSFQVLKTKRGLLSQDVSTVSHIFLSTVCCKGKAVKEEVIIVKKGQKTV